LADLTARVQAVRLERETLLRQKQEWQSLLSETEVEMDRLVFVDTVPQDVQNEYSFNRLL
jgi:hypothetical protein